MSPQDTQLNTISYIFLPNQIKYYKTSLKGPLKKKTKTWDSRPTIAYLMQVKVLQNAPKGAFCNILTFMKVPFVMKMFL